MVFSKADTAVFDRRSIGLTSKFKPRLSEHLCSLSQTGLMSKLVYYAILLSILKIQGYSLGVERLGLETVSRRFLERIVSSRS